MPVANQICTLALGLTLFLAVLPSAAENEYRYESKNCDYAIEYPGKPHLAPPRDSLNDLESPLIVTYKKEKFEFTYICTPNTLYVLPTEEQMCGLMKKGEENVGKLVECIYGADKREAVAMGFWEIPYTNGGNFLMIEKVTVSRRSRLILQFSSFGLKAEQRFEEFEKARKAAKWLGEKGSD